MVSFTKIKKGSHYSRHELAELWDYSSFHAIARGVVTPRYDNKIILFVTEEKQTSSEQYADRLEGEILHWEGPTDHFAEERMCAAESTDDEIHLFHRYRHHTDFSYIGVINVIKFSIKNDKPSHFTFKINNG